MEEQYMHSVNIKMFTEQPIFHFEQKSKLLDWRSICGTISSNYKPLSQRCNCIQSKCEWKFQ